MKFIFLSIVFFSFFPGVQAKKATISGQIVNGLNDTICVGFPTRFIPSSEKEECIISTTGAFTIERDIDSPREVALSCRGRQLKIFIEPGQNTQIEWTLNYASQQVSFAGDGIANNQFFNKLNEQFVSTLDKKLMKEKLLALTIDSWEDELFRNKNAMNKAIREAEGAKDFSPAFVMYLNHLVTYTYWRGLFAFPIEQANRSNTILFVQSIPNVMLEGFDKMGQSNDEALGAGVYRDFLNYFITYFTSEANGFNKFKDYSLSIQRKQNTAKQLLKDQSYLYFMTQLVLNNYKFIPPPQVKGLYEMIKETDATKFYAEEINKTCSDYMKGRETAAKGDEKPAGTESFTMTGLDGKKISLDDFKGKVVYIDFWASWCGPCRQQFPFSKELHSKFTEKELKKIVFLYISIDANEEGWRNAIKQNELEGVQGLSPGNWSSEACKYFKINSIPRYMIMNKKGNIVDINAKRPADPSLFDELKKLLEE